VKDQSCRARSNPKAKIGRLPGHGRKRLTTASTQAKTPAAGLRSSQQGSLLSGGPAAQAGYADGQLQRGQGTYWTVGRIFKDDTAGSYPL
jgi:hypothetical protein